jgi:hypothetical protein
MCSMSASLEQSAISSAGGASVHGSASKNSPRNTSQEIASDNSFEEMATPWYALIA